MNSKNLISLAGIILAVFTLLYVSTIKEQPAPQQPVDLTMLKQPELPQSYYCELPIPDLAQTKLNYEPDVKFTSNADSAIVFPKQLFQRN